jgi:PPM family protein phosphatase
MKTDDERTSTLRPDGLRYAAASDRGRVRTSNQDAWTVDREQGLFIVCDGIGGHLAGDVAARIVTQSLPAVLRDSLGGVADLSDPWAADQATQVVADLSRRVREESTGQPGLDGMGTTLVLALVRNLTALIVHLGDSRAYLHRAGRLERLTKDHTVVQALVDGGQLSPATSDLHPASGRLSRYIGMEGAALPQARVVHLQAGDRLLLCTDGLSGMVPDDRIEYLLGLDPELPPACRRLVTAANDAGGRDNITVLLVRLEF